MEEFSTILAYFISIITIINPIGAIPVFISLTSNNTKAEIEKIIKKASLVVCIILIISLLVGNYIITFFGISINSLRMAGGFIIISSGFSLMFSGYKKHKGINEEVTDEAKEKDDISITPLAMPMLAGPGAISLMIGVKSEIQSMYSYIYMILAIILVSISVYFVLKSGKIISNYFGISGLNAMSRIIGFLIIAIGIEYISSSISSILNNIIH